MPSLLVTFLGKGCPGCFHRRTGHEKSVAKIPSSPSWEHHWSPPSPLRRGDRRWGPVWAPCNRCMLQELSENAVLCDSSLLTLHSRVPRACSFLCVVNVFKYLRVRVWLEVWRRRKGADGFGASSWGSPRWANAGPVLGFSFCTGLWAGCRVVQKQAGFYPADFRPLTSLASWQGTESSSSEARSWWLCRDRGVKQQTGELRAARWHRPGDFGAAKDVVDGKTEFQHR